MPLALLVVGSVVIVQRAMGGGVKRMLRRSTRTVGALIPIMAPIVGLWIVIRPSPTDRVSDRLGL